MATFATNSEVETRIAGGTDTLALLTETTPYSATVVTAAREAAYGWIRAKLGTKYQIPADLSPYAGVAAFLRELELDLVEESLWGRVREQMPERVKQKADKARALLDAIAAGQAVVPADVPLPSATGGGSTAATAGSERVFTRENLDGMF